MDKSVITVNIFGSEYTIKGVAQPDYIVSLAAFLNEKMHEIQEATGLKDEKKIAILAGINICDELFESRKSTKEAFVPKDQMQSIRNRVEELSAFARARGMRRVGVAFCVSLIRESQALAARLEADGLETELVCCRVGAIDMTEVGLQKANPDRFTATCNPAAQARLLNARDVDLVAQVGLCIGHDLVLQEECAAPVTTLVVKDRALDHHTVRALRSAGG